MDLGVLDNFEVGLAMQKSVMPCFNESLKLNHLHQPLFLFCGAHHNAELLPTYRLALFADNHETNWAPAHKTSTVGSPPQ
jgi:hypothetical protein